MFGVWRSGYWQEQFSHQARGDIKKHEFAAHTLNKDKAHCMLTS